MRIDHVIWAAYDLDVAASRIESELALTTVPGGRHEGHGTQNRIVPLGGGYLELLAVADAGEAADSPIGSALLAHLAERGEGLFAWSVAAEDLESIAARLGLPTTTVSREGLTARLVGVAEALRQPTLPFFIERDEGVPDPGTGGNAGGITWVEVSGDHNALERWMAGVELPVRIADGPPALLGVGIGDRELRTR